MSDEEPFLPGSANVSSFVASLFRSVVKTSKTTNALPTSGNDFDFYASFPAFQEAMKLEGDRLLDLMTLIMKHQSAPNCRLDHEASANDLEEKTEAVIDANDFILEKVNNLLDEAVGKKKVDPSLVVASVKDRSTSSRVATWNRATAGVGLRVRDSDKSVKLLAAKNVPRPQLAFKDVIDNSELPFVSKMRSKPHAKTPFYGFQASDVDGDDVLHPYLQEIRTLVYPEHQLEPHPEPLPFPDPVEASTHTLVNTVAGLVTLRCELESVDAFAVDLEAHFFRSFQGITCLMQISTATKDYIVDVLVPEIRAELQTLNVVFTDPSIVKIFHGADSDIKWLQRDFGIYVVNMFDTYWASKILEVPRHSLAYLLAHYCDVDTNKKYQMADWRIRPLPEELLTYARTDTHYLLYIAARMKNELLERGNSSKNLLTTTLSKSAEVTLQLYHKPAFNPQGYRSILHNHKKMFNAQQLAALESLYAWRETLARREDESLGFVLPNHMMLAIAEVLPREPNGILACCNPLPPMVKQQLNEIHRLILDAKDVTIAKTGLPVKPVNPVLKMYATKPEYNSEKLLKCPIDSSHAVEEEDHRFVQLGADDDDVVSEAEPQLRFGAPSDVRESFLDAASTIHPRGEAAAKAAAIHASLLSPFRLFHPAALTARLPPVKPEPPKWRIRMIKRSSKLMEIQKTAAETERKRLRGDVNHAEQAEIAKLEKMGNKKVIPLSVLKEMEQEQKDRKGIKTKDKVKKKKKKMVRLNAGEEIDATEVNKAKAKLFRESKKETTVLGTKNEEIVVVDLETEDDAGNATSSDLPRKRSSQSPTTSTAVKKKKLQPEIKPFDYSKSDVKIFGKGVDKKKAASAQINPNASLLKKKKGGVKKMGKQHYGTKDSFTTGVFGNNKKGGGSTGKR